jgi:serine/threonine-protein kinase
LIGEVVGEYRIVSQLGTSAVADVFAGEHTDTGAKAAIELVHPQVAVHAEPMRQYLEVVRTVGKIKHGGTLKILDVGADATGRGYVVHELLAGETLGRRIETSGRLSITQIGEIGRQLANVLAATHDEGIIHGDVRPDVVFLLPQGGLARGEPIKVIELGVAALKRAIGIPIGPVYTAPEMLGSGEPIDWRVDAYGLGCVAFEMATGRPPFVGASADEVRTKHLEHVPPAARSLMPDVSPALDVLIGRLLSKRPGDRFSSMREIARVFEALGGGASSRPLAQTATDTPVLVLGELQAKGEIQAKPVAPSPAVPAPQVVATDSIEVAPGVTATIHRQPQKKSKSKSKLPAIVIGVVIVAGGVTALALGMRGGSSEPTNATTNAGAPK